MGKNKFGGFLLRAGINTVIASIILGLVSGFLVTLSATTDAFVKAGETILGVRFAWMVLNKRPGNESMLMLLIGVISGGAVLSLLSAFGLNIGGLDTSTLNIFSVEFLIFVASYFGADYFAGTWFKRR